MGSSSPQNAINSRWEYVRQQSSKRIVVRDKCGREGEQYKILISSSMIISEESTIYNKRKTSPHQIVSVYGSEILTGQESFCSNTTYFRVITQYLNVRFCQQFKLNLPEAIYILAEALKGFFYLYRRVGCFHITQNMLGLTAQGELKVWMNRNYGKNYPQYPKDSMIVVASESILPNQEEVFMIRDIIKIVQSRCQRNNVTSYFTFLQPKISNFLQTSKFIQNSRASFKISKIQRIDLAKKLLVYQ